MNQQENNLRLAFYDGSDGPRVMIFGPLEADFQSLTLLFRQLSHEPSEALNLESQPFITAFGGIKIGLSCTGKLLKSSHLQPQGIRRVSNSGDLHFQWARTAEGWDYLAELIDPFTHKSQAGHQYLTRYPDEDAIVVISKGEYTDEVLQQL